MEFGKQLTRLRNPDTRIGKAGVATGAMLASFALWASACGAENNGDSHARLTFDYLGGGSKVIRVYPGVENTPTDKHYDGTYYDGDEVPADCKTQGREVHSDPSLGEQWRQSDEWIRIEGPSQHKLYYATAVYVENPHQLLMKLPEC